MFIEQQSSFTSPGFVKHGDKRLWLLASGAGSVRVERRDQTGNFKAFPEMTFTAPCAQVIELPPGELRVVISAGPIDVEVVQV